MYQALLELFGFRQDDHALGVLKDAERDKYNYERVFLPLSQSVVENHLSGLEVIGGYLLHEGTIKVFCADFDAPKGFDGDTDAKFQAALQDALVQAEVFEEAGLFVELERSRSGSGVHLWVFFDEFVDAYLVRQALFPLLDRAASTLDRGKVYPTDPAKTKTGLGNVICLPFQGRAVQKGYNCFLNRETLEAVEPEAWLTTVTPNAAAVLRRLAESAPKTSTSSSTSSPRAVSVGQGWGDGNGGRPEPLLETGILKMCSPKGCAFMHHMLYDRHDPKLGEAEWYAAMGQLTAFKHGREAAHLMWGDHKYYDRVSTDAKYDHAMQSPPMGCAAIRERFPHLACQGCPGKAPYYKAMASCVELAQSASGEMEQGQFDDDLVRIERRDRGQEATGVSCGIPGLSKYFRFRDSELTFIGAQPSMGKTAMMVDMALNMAWDGTEVYVFSAETDREPLHDRILAHEALIDSRALRGERPGEPLTDLEWARLRKAARDLKGLPLYENYAALHVDDMIALQEANMIRRGVPLWKRFVTLFDYLQYGAAAQTGQETEYAILTRRAFEFKAYQKVVHRPTGVFSQLIRKSEGEEVPSITWWRGTGAIEQLMDCGIILTGERVVGPEAPRELWLVKQKEGEVGMSVPTVLKQAVCRFETREVRRDEEPIKDDSPQQEFGNWRTK